MIITTNKELILNSTSVDNWVLLFHEIPSKKFVLPNDDFTVEKNIGFFLRNCQLPAITNGEIKIPRAGNLPISSFETRLDFSPLTLEIVVDDKLQNYKLLQYWMFMKANPDGMGLDGIQEKDLFGKASLIVLSNTKEKIEEYLFEDLHPTDLGELEFNFQGDEEQVVSVTFGFTRFLPSNYFKVRYDGIQAIKES